MCFQNAVGNLVSLLILIHRGVFHQQELGTLQFL